MNLITAIKEKFRQHPHSSCGCGHADEHDRSDAPAAITPDMIVKEVTAQWPQTIAVFGNHRVDFCCGGAHSIAQTAQARGCRDVEALVRDLNEAIK